MYAKLKTVLVLDGLDGVGKTSTVQGLLEYFKEEDISAVQYREPGGTPFGEELRKILLGTQEITPLTQFYLFQAARSELMERLRQETAQIVVLDRFWPSTLAYQVHGNRVSRDLFFECRRETIQQIASAGYKDRYVYLELPEPERLKRLAATGKTGDRYESKGAEFYERVARGYSEYRLAADCVVNTMMPTNEVVTTIGRWLLSLR